MTSLRVEVGSIASPRALFSARNQLLPIFRVDHTTCVPVTEARPLLMDGHIVLLLGAENNGEGFKLVQGLGSVPLSCISSHPSERVQANHPNGKPSSHRNEELASSAAATMTT